jgi:hypothetical protein
MSRKTREQLQQEIEALQVQNQQLHAREALRAEQNRASSQKYRDRMREQDRVSLTTYVPRQHLAACRAALHAIVAGHRQQAPIPVSATPNDPNGDPVEQTARAMEALAQTIRQSRQLEREQGCRLWMAWDQLRGALKMVRIYEKYCRPGNPTVDEQGEVEGEVGEETAPEGSEPANQIDPVQRHA